jgi:hypothetical protein
MHLSVYGILYKETIFINGKINTNGFISNNFEFQVFYPKNIPWLSIKSLSIVSRSLTEILV